MDEQNEVSPADVWALVHGDKGSVKTVAKRLGIPAYEIYELPVQERKRRDLAEMQRPISSTKPRKS
jgi:hypothetical protein